MISSATRSCGIFSLKWGGDMNKLWMHTLANIRKTKSASATLVCMFIIAAFLLNAGLLVAINYGSFFDALKEELVPSDVYYMLPDALYTDEIKSYLDENEHIQKTQKNDGILLGARLSFKGKEQTHNILFCNMDEKREISKWKFVDDHLPAEEMSVYVPDVFKAVSGYQLNDKLDLNFLDENTNTEKTLSFMIKGYTEDIYFSSVDTGFMSFYLTPDTYQKVADIIDNPKNNMNLVFANLDNVDNGNAIESGIREILHLDTSSLLSGDASSLFVVIDLQLVEMARCMMASMVSVMMVVFSMIIAIVCLLVVRFRIVNSIEEDILKIGSLKAIGYTSRQIILSVILQFSLIAGIGSLVGIALSYPALPTVAAVFEQQSGLKWEQGFDGAISASAFLVLLLIVVLVARIAAHRLSRLSPISALRGEVTARQYKRNHLPLEKARGTLPVVLAFKSVLQSMKQNIMIGVILVSVTFAGAFGVIMFYNTSIDTKAFAEVPGMEICNAVAILNPEKDHTQAIETIKSMDAVRKVHYLDEVKVKVDGGEASAFVMDDYSTKESMLVYEGYYPKEQNEITLAGILAERLHKTIDDTVTVSFGDREEAFKIVGLSNGSSMGGLNSSILAEDFKRLNPDYKQQALYIYLDKGYSAAVFIEELTSQLDKEILLGAINFDDELAEGMASYQNIVAAMGLAMLVITLVVVALVLYFVISSSVIRKRRQLGIQKAIGFTTFQLMNQLAVSFTVPIILGAVIGSLLGAFYTNPLMSVTMRSMGVMKARFIVDPYWVIAFGVATILFSYVLSLMITWRIRKISAYALVTE
jgi:putative ABC transport system permease protein